MSSPILLTSIPEVQDAVRVLTSRGVLGLDFETTGIDPHLDSALLLGLDEYVIPCTRLPGWEREVRGLIQDPAIKKIIHNAVFDGMFCMKYGIYPQGVVDTMIGAKLPNVGQVWEKGRFTLATLLDKCLYVKHDKELQTSFIGADPATFVATQEQLEYLARDTMYLLPLADYLWDKLEPRGLIPTWKLENNYTQVIAMMQMFGAIVHIAGYQPELDKAEEEFTRLEKEVAEKLTPYILKVRARKFAAAKEKYDAWKAEYDEAQDLARETVYGPGVVGGTQEQRDEFNSLNRAWKGEHKEPTRPVMNANPIEVTSPQQINDSLVEMGLNVPDTQKDTLVLFSAGQDDEAQKLLGMLGELSGVKKIRSNEGAKLLGRLRHPDWLPEEYGLLTTRYDQLKETGRIGSGLWKDDVRKTEWGANVQNLTARFKQHVVAGAGRKFVVADYSQIELRVAAELILREDPNAHDSLVKAFRDGLDPHSDTAARCAGWKYEDFLALHLSAEEHKQHGVPLTKDERWAENQRHAGKTTNFSTVFFISDQKLAAKIYVAIKSTVPFGAKQIEEAGRFKKAFWDGNPTLLRVLNRYGDDALRDKYTTTLGGRKRYYYDVYPGMPKWTQGHIRRQAANHPIQGTAADIAKDAQASLYADVVEHGVAPAYIFAAVHDEIGMNTAEDLAELWRDRLADHCTRAYETYITHIPCGLSKGIYDTWQH